MWLSPKVLPRRNAKTMPADFSTLAATLARDYGLDGPSALFGREQGAAELVVPPRSGLIGHVVFAGMVTESGDLVVLGVHRDGEALGPGEVVLAAGDALLVRGTWQALAEQLTDDDVVVVDEPAAVRRQVVPLGLGAKEALAVLGGMVVLLATGDRAARPWRALVAAGACSCCCASSRRRPAYRGISWTTVVLVAGMIPLSTAMTDTGAAGLIADQLVAVVRDLGPYALLRGPVPGHGGLRPADQQHGHGADRDPDRPRGRGGSRG